MKISRKIAVAFLVALGFTKSKDWDDDRLKKKLKEAPSKIDAGDIPDGQEEFYRELTKADGEVEFVEKPAGDGEEEAEPKAAKGEKKEKAGKSAKSEKGAAEAKPAKAGKDAKRDKPTPLKGEKADKALGFQPEKAKVAKAPPVKAKIPRDEFGCAEGTISFEVNKKVNEEWQSEQEIADAAGVTLDQARGRLYYGAEKEEFEHRRMIQYRRMGPKTKKAK